MPLSAGSKVPVIFELPRPDMSHLPTPGRSGGQSWIRTSEGVSQRIYSPPRLATSVSTLSLKKGGGAIYDALPDRASLSRVNRRGGNSEGRSACRAANPRLHLVVSDGLPDFPPRALH